MEGMAIGGGNQRWIEVRFINVRKMNIFSLTGSIFFVINVHKMNK